MRTSAAVESLLSLSSAGGDWRPLSPASSVSSEPHSLRVAREEIVRSAEDEERGGGAAAEEEECTYVQQTSAAGSSSPVDEVSWCWETVCLHLVAT